MFALFKIPELCKHSQSHQNSHVQREMASYSHCNVTPELLVIDIAGLSVRTGVGYLRLLAQVLPPPSFPHISSYWQDNANAWAMVPAITEGDSSRDVLFMPSSIQLSNITAT